MFFISALFVCFQFIYLADMIFALDLTKHIHKTLLSLGDLEKYCLAKYFKLVKMQIEHVVKISQQIYDLQNGNFSRNDKFTFYVVEHLTFMVRFRGS